MINSISHYKWLNKHLNSFFENVLGKNLESTSCSGIISAYGDKCHCYKKKWENANIPFPHGVAIFLLSYYIETEDGINVCQFVIDNYTKYKEFLPKIDFNDPDLI